VIGPYLHTVAPHSELIVTEGGSHVLPVTHAPELALSFTRRLGDAGQPDAGAANAAIRSAAFSPASLFV
jgi:hypothetical protein